MRSPLHIGTDIVDVARIGRLVRNKRFLARIFTADEIRYCASKKNPPQHFAVRFAAKEAVWKALATIAGLKGLSHQQIGVNRSPSGQPFVALTGPLKKYEKRVSLSLSHTDEYALAVAVYLGQ